VSAKKMAKAPFRKAIFLLSGYSLQVLIAFSLHYSATPGFPLLSLTRFSAWYVGPFSKELYNYETTMPL
jgi:hypothetical protein